MNSDTWVPLTRRQAVKKYGDIYLHKGNLTWPDAMFHCTMFEVPSYAQPYLINTATKKPTKKIYCNKDMVLPLQAAFSNLRHAGLIKELKSFDGCFNLRRVRGAEAISWHAWGMAIDINASTNRLGEVGDMGSAMVAAFRDAGFIWGGNFKRIDMQHFQLGLD